MKKKDGSGENIVSLLDDFRMIGENGFHILLLGVLQLWVSKAQACLGELQGGVKTELCAPVRRMSRTIAGSGHTEVAGGERLDMEVFGCSDEGQKLTAASSLLVNP